MTDTKTLMGMVCLCASLVMYLAFHTEEASLANRIIVVVAFWGACLSIWAHLTQRETRKEDSG
jgi:hypothetical protein